MRARGPSRLYRDAVPLPHPIAKMTDQLGTHLREALDGSPAIAAVADNLRRVAVVGGAIVAVLLLVLVALMRR